MQRNSTQCALLFVAGAFLTVVLASAQQSKTAFTVADEIGLTLFCTPDGGPPEVRFSPDGTYVAVWSERGRLDLNRVEDSLRFYRRLDVENFLTRSDELRNPSPLWVVERFGKEGPVLNDWRWLADSSGVAFLERIDNGKQGLVVADIRKRTFHSLTSATEQVDRFDIIDRQHYVYAAEDKPEGKKRRDERQSPVVVGTGRSIYELILPTNPVTTQMALRRKFVWAVVGSRRFEVKRNGEPLALGEEFALSRDGLSLVATLPVTKIPHDWEMLYPPPYVSSPQNHIHVGRPDVHQYVRIDLETSLAEPLTDAPIASDAGWSWGGSGPSWSRDGQEVLLPGTFLRSRDSTPSRPCVAVVELRTNTSACVEMLKRRAETTVEDGYHTIVGAEFVGGDKRRVMVRFYNRPDESYEDTEYRRNDHGTWQVSGQFKVGRTEYDGLEIVLKQAFNAPPLLVATKEQVSRTIWDPNPQLKNFELGETNAYTWRDEEGWEWRGGLFVPPDYKPGRRYPLVIQNHGFDESRFLPSGVFPTGFAARALAAQGIVVLQVGTSKGHCPDQTEGPCMASGYESAARQLVSEGLVDGDRIGIIGFSRTCFYVMELLTTGSIHVKAASITDGVMLSYSQFLLHPERLGSNYTLMIGAPPFGEGLQQWLKRSPTFNLDKITAPLLVVAEGPDDVLFMWEPYAGLHYLHKPVDLIMLNTDEHVLTNPAVRMASQGGSVDWFRFWLKDEEDPNPVKVPQYSRWRELRQLQETNEHNRTITRAASD